MPTNEEGEFELVLGNKQLLSVFFLVILLLGVFFSMGYIVGRNTAPSPSLSASSRQQPPIVVDSSPSSPVRPAAGSGVLTPVTASPIPDTPKPSPSDEKPPKPEVAKQQPEPPKPAAAAKAEPPKPAPAAPKVEAPKPAVAKVEPPKPAPAPVAAAPSKGGTYLQVVATKPAEAQQVVAKLAGQGFAATTSPVPNSPLVRVLVGPVSDANLAKTRDGLTAAGYKPMARKM